MVLRISGGHGLCHFHTFLCNMGSSCISTTWGLACTPRRQFFSIPHFPCYIFIPQEGAAIDAILIVSVCKYPHIDCTIISLRERRARRLHSENLFCHIFEDGWAIVPAGNIFCLRTSRFGKSSVYTIQECPGTLDLGRKRVLLWLPRWSLIYGRERDCYLWLLRFNFVGTWPEPFDAACCAAGKAYHWEGCI